MLRHIKRLTGGPACPGPIPFSHPHPRPYSEALAVGPPRQGRNHGSRHWATRRECGSRPVACPQPSPHSQKFIQSVRRSLWVGRDRGPARQGAAIRDAGPAAPAFPRRPRVHAPNLRTCRCTMDGTLRSTTVCRGTNPPRTTPAQDALSRRWQAGGWFGGEIWRANPSASVIFSPAASVPRWRGAVWITGFVRAVLRSGSETFPDWTPCIPCVVGGGGARSSATLSTRANIKFPPAPRPSFPMCMSWASLLCAPTRVTPGIACFHVLVEKLFRCGRGRNLKLNPCELHAHVHVHLRNSSVQPINEAKSLVAALTRFSSSVSRQEGPWGFVLWVGFKTRIWNTSHPRPCKTPTAQSPWYLTFALA